ncbi:MAG: iron ABC transporter substrate-binding protein, partial [Psychrosphaera sp.]|nr:iron ABC transporter substrate-binding protein [Psychrosphaera sp.]
MKKSVLAVLLLLVTQVHVAMAENVVNIYSYRQPFLINPILETFTNKTGIKTKVVFAKKGWLERLKREGKYSPEDVVLTTI